MNYIAYIFYPEKEVQAEQLIALLSNQGFDGFEEIANTLKAFIPEEKFDEVSFNETIQLFPSIIYEKKIIENINWNAQWEQGFQPVLVDDFAAVRASFHEPIPGVQHDIIITPKMSFGTGHHGTTYLMIREMSGIDFTGKTVFDFGTGTGVLAILAEKLGAAEVDAIDIDEWSVTNTIENIEANRVSKVTIGQADHIPTGKVYDIVLANINLNVILASLDDIYKITQTGGHVLLSGFLTADELQMTAAVGSAGFHIADVVQKEGWLCFHIVKKQPVEI